MNWRHTFPYLCFQACVSSKIKSSKWMYHADNIASCHHIQAAQLNEVLAHFVKRSKKWHIFRQHYAVGSLKHYSFFPLLYRHRFILLSQDTLPIFFFDLWSQSLLHWAPDWLLVDIFPGFWSSSLRHIFIFMRKMWKETYLGWKRASTLWRDTRIHAASL